MPRTVKVAVVGSGLAGLTVAHLLSKTEPSGDLEFQVHVFEKGSSLGMDSSSISISFNDQKKDWRIDVPMRSFQGGYYPQLIRLYKSLGIAFRKADFSYSFSFFTPSTHTQGRRITTTMIYNGSSGRDGVSMPSLMKEPYLLAKNESFLVKRLTKLNTILHFVIVTMQIVFHYLRLVLLSIPFLRPANLEHLTFKEWTKSTTPKGALARWSGLDKSWEGFTKHVLVPLFSAVCTASEGDVMAHPMQEFLDYIWLTFGTHHYVVVNGVQDVVNRLTTNIKYIHLSSPISAITADPQDPSFADVHCAVPSTSETKVYTGFNHIIFAAQANSAVPILKNYLSSLPPSSSEQRERIDGLVKCLGTFRYRPTIVINHTDGSLMPDHPADKRDLNLVCLDPNAPPLTESDPNCVGQSYTMATHVLPLSPKPARTVYQTTNPIISPEPSSILSIARLERAILTPSSKRSLSLLSKPHPTRRTRWWRECPVLQESTLGDLQGRVGGNGVGVWVCGSYASAGIPLLEGCVVSAKNVVKGILKSEGESGNYKL